VRKSVRTLVDESQKRNSGSGWCFLLLGKITFQPPTDRVQ